MEKFKKTRFQFICKRYFDSLINYLGEKGTLIIPTFNFDFCSGKIYDIKNTKSQMGIFSEIARIEAVKNRSWHPVYSFVLFGNIPIKELKKENYSALGKESLFNWITESDGKISIIDLPDQKSMTYYHHVEELKKVNYRFLKIFKGKYINFQNETDEITAEIFVRRTDYGVETQVNEMEKFLWSKNLYIGHNNSSHRGCRSIFARKLKKEVMNIIETNRAEDYCTNQLKK